MDELYAVGWRTPGLSRQWVVAVYPCQHDCLWNTIYMQAALDQHRADGHSVRPEDEARLSPLGHEHINLLGRYSFAVPESVARGELRPLRNPADGGR